MRFVSSLCLVTLLSACASAPPPGPLPKLTFAQLQPLPIDAERVTVSSDVPDRQGQNPLSISVPNAFADYAKQRFVGMGGPGTGTLAVTLNETRVSRGTQNTDNKWTAWTRLDQSDAYTTAIKATFRYDGPNGLFKTATLQQQRGLEIPQRTSLRERQRLEQAMVEKLIADFDAQALTALQTQMNVLSAVH